MLKPLRILLIQNSDDDARLLLSEIRNGGYEPVYKQIETAAATKQALESEFWEIVLCDFDLPHFSGLIALTLVRHHDPDLPFIITSGQAGEYLAVDAMRAGAQDYVMKNNLSRLVPAIERELRESVVRREGRHAQRELEKNESHFRGLVSNVPGVVFQLYRDNMGGLHFSYVSEGSAQLLELAPRQLINDSGAFHELVLDDGNERLRQMIDASGRTGTAINWEGRIRVASGDFVKWIEIRMSPRTLSGQRMHWDGIMENISQRKKAESELLRSRQQLAALSTHLQKAKEIERTSIAREVHDNIGGNLTAMKIDLLWLNNRIDRSRTDLLAKAGSIEALLDRTMEITSRIARDLRPPLIELGLLAAIEWEAADFQKRMEIPCIVNCMTDDMAIDPDLANAAFSVFREILTNISKHAAATKVEVDLGTDDSQLIMKVTDNGRGMTNADLLKRGSFGLRGMLERARSLGGEIRFDGKKGGGTSITAVLPLDPITQPPENLLRAGAR
jgi:two-component system, NarL family, sensor histidine kinase UhpB